MRVGQRNVCQMSVHYQNAYIRIAVYIHLSGIPFP